MQWATSEANDDSGRTTRDPSETEDRSHMGAAHRNRGSRDGKPRHDRTTG